MPKTYIFRAWLGLIKAFFTSSAGRGTKTISLLKSMVKLGISESKRWAVSVRWEPWRACSVLCLCHHFSKTAGKDPDFAQELMPRGVFSLPN